MRDNIEWVEVESSDYGVRYKNLINPIDWITNTKSKRMKDFYMENGRPSKIIIDNIKKILDGTKK